MVRKIHTTEDLIKKFIEIHGNIYDYSKVNLGKCDIPVVIICSIHGDFSQLYSSHLDGKGCKFCGGSLRKTTEQYVAEAKLIHGDEYNYSLTIYNGSKSKIKIICKEHGIFEQEAKSHITNNKGHGCGKCDGNAILSTNEFIEMAKKVHGNLYDYNKVNYIKSSKNIKIICKKHGEFKQTPNGHLSGRGCDKCGGSFELTTKEFINKAIEVHGYLYNYSNVIYVNSSKKVKIICKKHGIFNQNAGNHLSGRGCRKCTKNISKPEIQWLNYLEIKEKYRAINFRLNGKLYRPDAFNSENNTIYEFYGDYWHGNPEKFKENDINKVAKKTFGELYQRTIQRENELRALGYNIISIWENDWKKIEKELKKANQ